MTADATSNEIERSLGEGRGGVSFSALWALYTLTLRQHRHGKRWILMGILLLLPAALAILVRATARDVPDIAVEFVFAYMFIPQAILPLIALIYAPGMIQDEEEEQTITYLLMRPIPKWLIYIAKLLATLTVALFLTILLTVLTYAAVYIGSSVGLQVLCVRCIKTSLIHGLAVISYCCLFGLFSLVTKRILIFGVIYIATVEGLFANLAFGIRLITVIYYARIIAYRVLPFVSVTPNGNEDLAGQAWQLDVHADPTLSSHPQVGTCIAILLIASTICSGLGAYLCSRREFHVKTQEKA